MMEMLNFLNDVANSNFAFTVLVIILVAVCIAMVYLIYAQNKEIKMETERRRLEVAKTKNSMRNREDPIEKKEEEVIEEIPEVEDTIDESLRDFEEIQEEVNNGDFGGVPYNKVIPEYEQLEDEEVITPEASNEEYNGSIEDLQSITKELEVLPREKTIELTPYEEEQESKAIISYDELVNTKYSEEINYSDNLDEDIGIKQVDLEKTGSIEMPELKEQIVKETLKNSYTHEEEFLNGLKDLQQNLLN